MKLRSVREADFSGKRVLVRVDFNVPIKDCQIVDDTRIRAALPSIVHLIKGGAKIILCSHLGRPKGQVVDGLRLDPIVPGLRDVLNFALVRSGMSPVKVAKLEACIGPEVEAEVAHIDAGIICLLENLRFEAGETKNDPEFAKQLSALADIYVSDAFGTVHRAHASTEGVAHLLPAYAGFLVEREVEELGKVLNNPRRPLTVVLGGAKISGKLEILHNLLPIADNLLIGGAMANTFLKAQGMEAGASLVENGLLDEANSLLLKAGEHGTNLMLPSDYVVTTNIQEASRVGTVPAESLQPDDIAADIGEKTRVAYADVIRSSGTVFWNGPMGVFEKDEFAGGSMAIALAMSELQFQAHTVVGGGESVTLVNRAGLADRISHVSTGGGASLEFIAGRELPGLKVLEEK